MKIFKLFFFLLINQLIFSQSISSYLLNVNKYDKNSNIYEIVEETTFYDSNKVQKEIEYKKFDTLMNLTSLKRFNDKNKLIWLNLYSYDSLGRKIGIDNKRWINVIGYQTNYTRYEYDSINNFLEVKYNSKNQVLGIWKYSFDEDKNLIRLENYDSKGYLFSYETASYNVDNNTMLVKVYDKKNNLKSSNNRQINYSGKYKQKTTNKYNEQGDLIYWERNWNKNDNVCYTTDYKYDDKGNWVLEKRYSYIKTSEGKLKNKELKMIKKRKLKYREYN